MIFLSLIELFALKFLIARETSEVHFLAWTYSLANLELTLFQTGAGHYGPGRHKLAAIFKALGLESPNFMTLYLLAFAKTQ